LSYYEKDNIMHSWNQNTVLYQLGVSVKLHLVDIFYMGLR